MPQFVLGTGQFGVTYSVTESVQTPAAAYAEWATALGVSSTDTLLAMDDDDNAWSIDLASAFFPGGAPTAAFSSEAGFGLYQTALSDDAILRWGDIDNVERMFLPISRPRLLLTFHSDSDLKSYQTKLQRSGSVTIIFAQYSNWGDDTTSRYDVAIRVDGGDLTMVGHALDAVVPIYWHEFQEGVGGRLVRQELVTEQAAGYGIRMAAQLSALQQQHATGVAVAPAVLGDPAAVAVIVAPPALITTAWMSGPTVLGEPSAQLQFSAPVITGTAFGSTTLVTIFRVQDSPLLSPFIPSTVSAIGMAPSGRAFQAQSMDATVFGVPSLSSSTSYAAESLVASVQFGVASVRSVYEASSLVATEFGQSDTAPIASYPATSIAGQVAFGQVTSRMVHGMGDWYAGPRISAVSVKSIGTFPVEDGLGPIEIGGCESPGMGYRALSLHANCKFGEITIRRSHSC